MKISVKHLLKTAGSLQIELPGKHVFLAVAFVLRCFSPAFSQTDSPPPAMEVVPTETIRTTEADTSHITSEVTEVISLNSGTPNEAAMGDEICVKVSNMAAFLDQARKYNANILLYVDNMPLNDVHYELSKSGINFYLNNVGSVLELWEHLTVTRLKGEFFKENVDITVGLEGKVPLPTQVNEQHKKTFVLVLVAKTFFWIAILLLLLLISVFVAFAAKSDMLRSTGIAPENGKKPFSLSRVQMAVWFIVIISCWLLLFVCLHRFDFLTESILILMGITAATGVGGLALDTGKSDSPTPPSKGLFIDIISDNSAVSLYRFQNVAWTAVLVVVFIRSVIVYLKMPDFDSTLLLLMGISSGTYIGAKVTEKTESAVIAEDKKMEGNG